MKTYTAPIIADRGALALFTNESFVVQNARELMDPDLFIHC